AFEPLHSRAQQSMERSGGNPWTVPFLAGARSLGAGRRGAFAPNRAPAGVRAPARGHAFLVGLERGVGFARAVSKASAEANLSKHRDEIDERAACSQPGAPHQLCAAAVMVELHEA